MRQFRTKRNQKWGEKIAKLNILFQMDVTREPDGLWTSDFIFETSVENNILGMYFRMNLDSLIHSEWMN